MTDTPNVDTPLLDTVAGFTITDRHARGRIARIGPVLDQILAAHAYPPPIEALLAEALALTALMGALLKEARGQLTLQAQAQGGIVTLLVCDYRDGDLRGYVQFDAERLGEVGETPSLYALFGQGYLAITFDQVTSGERYQGIVPLDGNSLAEAAQSYFIQSEQIPSLVRLATGHRPGGGRVAAGLFLQHLPEGEVGRERLHSRMDHPEWDHVQALGQTVEESELLDETLPIETLVWRLFNEEREVRMLLQTPLAKGCRCDPEYIAQVLAKFSPEERAEMADEDGIIGVDCAFCSTRFPVPLAAV